jgi:hypothetical protein
MQLKAADCKVQTGGEQQGTYAFASSLDAHVGFGLYYRANCSRLRPVSGDLEARTSVCEGIIATPGALDAGTRMGGVEAEGRGARPHEALTLLLTTNPK